MRSVYGHLITKFSWMDRFYLLGGYARALVEPRYNRGAVNTGKESRLSSVNNAGTKIAWTCLWSEGKNLTGCKLCGAFSRGSLTSNSLIRPFSIFLHRRIAFYLPFCCFFFLLKSSYFTIVGLPLETAEQRKWHGSTHVHF